MGTASDSDPLIGGLIGAPGPPSDVPPKLPRAPRSTPPLLSWGALTDRLETAGAVIVLAGRTISSAARPPYSYGSELVAQFLFAVRLGWFPMIVSSFALAYGPSGTQAASFLSLFGALDRLGGLFSLAVIREFAPLVCAIVMAGVAGTAMCADLGARKIREELDALMVLGVDPIKSLVVPRFLALMAVTTLFDVYALAFGTLGGIAVSLVNGAPLGPFFATYFENATTIELVASFIKTALFGAIIAIACCYKGMTASGGAEGVGRAVNQAVVISFLAIGAFNYIFTQTLLALFPELSLVR
jgi:phospholipid/cholesterol/gamma-HCH transport system permease protein